MGFGGMTQMTGHSMRADWRAAWSAVRERLRRELGDAVFEAWIAPLSLEGFEHDELSIGAAKPFVRNWVANHYVPRIERAFRAEGCTPASITIVMAAPSIGANVPPAREEALPATVSYLPGRTEPAPPTPHADDSARGLWNRMLHPQQTFDSFIPGGANAFGHGAARDFAEGGQADLPLLYIHGGFGYGKTHLLNARGAGIPQARQAHAVPAGGRFHASLPGRALSQGHAGLQGRIAHRRSADHRRPAAYLPQRRHGVGISLHRQCLCRPAPPGGDRRRHAPLPAWKAWAPT